MSAIAFVITHVLTLAAIFLVVACAGAIVVRRGDLALTCAAGMAIVAHVLFLLAATGTLRRPFVIVICFAILIGGVRRIRIAPRTYGVVAICVLLPLFALALTPPTAFDETLYHLPLVRALAEEGHLAFRGDLRFPVFPLLGDLLAVPPFLFAGDIATHLVPLAATLIAAGLLLEWGRRRGIVAAPIAAAAFLGAPIVVHLATSLYIDAVLTLFVVAAFYCLDRALSGSPRWLIGAGFFLGTAASVKYLAGYFAVVAGVAILMGARRRLRSAVLFAIAFALASLPTYAWIVWTTGNPVFPFFGSSAWVVPMLPPMSLSTRAIDFVRIPWDVLFARNRVGLQPPFTPFFALAWIGIAVAALRKRRARLALSLALGYLVCFTFLHRDARYLLPLLPLVLLEGAAAVGAVPRRVIVVLATLALLGGAAYVSFRMIHDGTPPLTHAARVAYLRRNIPEYRALRAAGVERVYACRGEQLKAHAGGPFFGDHFGTETFKSVLGDGRDAQRIHHQLVRRRISRLLVVKADCYATGIGEPAFTLLYDDASAQLWRVNP
jgi:hypothetical protein